MNDHFFSKKNFKRSYLLNGVAENLGMNVRRVIIFLLKTL
jgi:hypothetical protein